MDEETERLVREISALIINEPPARACGAMCGILGVLTAHVISRLPEDEKPAALEGSLALIHESIVVSYIEFRDWTAEAIGRA